MRLEEELDLQLRARSPLITILSSEEERVIEAVQRLAEKRGDRLYLWDHADYFQQLVGEGETLAAKDPLTALEVIEKFAHRAIFLLRDYHQCWKNQPKIVRKLRNLSQGLKYTHKSIIVSTPTEDLPAELRDEMVLLDFPLPGQEELHGILKALLRSPKVQHKLNADTGQRVIRAALGLTANQAQRAFARAIVTNGVLDERDIQSITAEKKQVLRESGALEFFAPSETLTDLGGLEVLKEWLRMRERAFSQEAKDYGIPEPKGVALIGVPGTGKSLTAKMVAALWQLPLIRLDVGALFGEFVGTSERNVRRALHLAETISPCVLWIDEIEKGLFTGGGDGGASMRVFATILSWMQEKRKPVFIVATANNVGLLPPELMRRGRFDEIFFLDLPTASERRKIFEVHIRKRGRDPQKFDLERLAQASERYVGSEIEQAVIDAMFIAFNDERIMEREFETADIMKALNRLVPLSHSQSEVIGYLREWLTEGRAQSASFREVEQATRKFVPVDINTVRRRKATQQREADNELVWEDDP